MLNLTDGLPACSWLPLMVSQAWSWLSFSLSLTQSLMPAHGSLSLSLTVSHAWSWRRSGYSHYVPVVPIRTAQLPRIPVDLLPPVWGAIDPVRSHAQSRTVTHMYSQAQSSTVKHKHRCGEHKSLVCQHLNLADSRHLFSLSLCLSLSLSHTHTHTLSLSLSIYLSIYVSISLYLSIYLCLYLPLTLSLSLSRLPVRLQLGSHSSVPPSLLRVRTARAQRQ